MPIELFLVSHPSCFLGNQHPASRTVCLNSEEGGMQPMSTHPLISCLSNDATALCWGVNVEKTESPEACPWDSIANEFFPLTEGPDPLRTSLVRALSSFLFLFTPCFFLFSHLFCQGARMSPLYSHEVGPFETHEKRKAPTPSPAHGKKAPSVPSSS